MLWAILLALLGAMGWLLVDTDFQFDLAVQLGVFLPGLFVGCLFCHGELYRLRPAPRRLTAFYLAVSAGGALGGLLVAVVAPLVFNGYYELGIALVVLALLAALRFATVGIVPRAARASRCCSASPPARRYDGFRYHARRARRDAQLLRRAAGEGVRRARRGAHLRRLVHGAIMHGEQYLHEKPARAAHHLLPARLRHRRARSARCREGRPVRVGVIGLGTGTLAAYGRAGRHLPLLRDRPARDRDRAHASSPTSRDSAAKIELALGDARLSLEREPPQGFDVLAVDAFSSDAIPVHLITREALGIYLRHMKPDGIVAFHVSNRFLDLIPVVARLAQGAGRARRAGARRSGRGGRTTAARAATGCWCRATRRRCKREAIVGARRRPGRGPAANGAPGPTTTRT